MRSRTLELEHAPPLWAPSPDTFAALVRGCVEKLDVVLGRYVRGAEIYVTDLPGAELVVDGVDPRAPLVLDTPPVEEGRPVAGAPVRLPAQRGTHGRLA